MAWTGFGRTLSKIGVIGSGQIGPDIALYFAKVLSPSGVRIVIHDIAPAALEAGAAKVRKKIEKGVESGAFKPAQAKEMLDHLVFTADKGELTGAQFIVEAATEDLKIKRKIFEDLAGRCDPGTLFASNSSHLEPEIIFEGIPNPARALVIHYFFPAERNPAVEVVPSKSTDPSVASFCMKFYEAIGKIPVRIGSRYGYAVDPIFEGLFLASLKMSDAGLATPKQIDAVAQKELGLGVGPFTAMNLTGGTPLTRIGLGHYHDKIMPWFEAPASMNRTEPWPTAGRDEKVEVEATLHEKIARRLKGAYFGLVAEVLESGITNVGDLDLAVETALVMKAPFSMMNKVGVAEAAKLVREYAAENPGFKVASCLNRTEPWKIPSLLREDREGVAVITVRRPKTLNALNRGVYGELRETFDALKRDPSVKGVVLTGFGSKAFVSGADIGMLAAVKSPAEGEAMSWESNEAMLRIADLGKPVVCALNGLALGGGSELAMSCSVRIARKGLPVCFGQPEPKLGIIPGAGATQRLPRIVGWERAWEILRTGRTVSGKEAREMGYLSEEFDGDLVERAVVLARELARTGDWPKMDPAPMKRPAKLPEGEIAGLSRKVDEILRKAVLEGCEKPLPDGARFESRCFGEVCGTKDMRIGLENFLQTQLKQPAKFVHA